VCAIFLHVKDPIAVISFRHYGELPGFVEFTLENQETVFFKLDSSFVTEKKVNWELIPQMLERAASIGGYRA
jgi:hypothetical protein